MKLFVLVVACRRARRGGRQRTSGAGPRTVLDGAYTEAQATRGENEYGTNCARCHGADLMAAAPPRRCIPSTSSIAGAKIISPRCFSSSAPTCRSRRGRPRWPQRTAVPRHRRVPAAGQRSALGFKRADDRRSRDAAGGRRWSEAAATERAGTSGRLSRASSRRMDADAIGGAGARAQQRRHDQSSGTGSVGPRPLGSLEYRLPNLGDDHKEPELLAQVGKKVQVKGVVNGQGSAARISVLSFSPLGQTCP